MFPEDSIAALTDCFLQGTEMIELDIHFTKDGYLIVNHDPCMDNSTNINEYEWLFLGRKQKKEVFAQGKNIFEPKEGYWWVDFTLAEIKMLRIKQRLEGR